MNVSDENTVRVWMDELFASEQTAWTLHTGTIESKGTRHLMHYYA